MTINIFVLNGDLNGKIVVVRLFFGWYSFDLDLNRDVHILLLTSISGSSSMVS